MWKQKPGAGLALRKWPFWSLGAYPRGVRYPRLEPRTTAGSLGGSFCSQMDGGIAGSQMPAIGEGLSALHHGQIDGSAITNDFGHSANIAVFLLELQIDGGPDRQELLQLSPPKGLIRLRSFRLYPKAAAIPSRGRGPGTELVDELSGVATP